MKKLTTLFLSIFSIFAPAIGQAQTPADSWHQWRGPENNGSSSTATPPLEWSEKSNVRWKAEIKGSGTASPIVWGNKVFITTAINTGEVDPSLPRPEDQPERVFGIKHPNTSYEMVVLCFDRNSGNQLWREVAKTVVPHEGHHKDASFAAGSSFCDGERIYCWFGSAGLYAYSLDGKKLWERDLGPAKMGASLGEGSSPVVHNGKLILVRDHSGQSTIECFDAKSGKTLWKKNRDEGNTWATPAIAEHEGTTQVITPGTNAIRSYNLATGDLIWRATGLTNNCAPCPIVDGTPEGGPAVYCMTGYKGHALLSIPITGTGDVTDKVLWKTDRGTPYVPSAALYDGQLYFTQSNQGILTSLEAKDGKEVIARTRVPELGDIYASPVAADGRVYLVGRKGTTVTIAAGKEFKVLATSQLDDNFHASPALAGKQLFLRGMRFLYCLEDGAAASTSKNKTTFATAKPNPSTGPKTVLSARLKGLVDAGKITGEEAIELYLTAFPGERDNVMRWLASLRKPEPNQPTAAEAPGKGRPVTKPKSAATMRERLQEIAKREIPEDYPGGDGHQSFVDQWFASAPPEKAGEVAQLWEEQQRLFPSMKNRGESFIRILDHVRSNGAPKKASPAQKPSNQLKKTNPHIKRKEPARIDRESGTITPGKIGTVAGSVGSLDGKPMEGVMVSAFDDRNRQNVSIFSQADGSFQIDDLHDAEYRLRARIPGQRDHWVEDVKIGDQGIKIRMEPATGKELEEQRPASDAFAQLKFDSPRDRLNFKMMCSYCHQIGTPGFRSPEEPVDWETMITRMDGFGGLYPHTKDTIVQRIIDTYKGEAVEAWPPYEPPPAPTGMVTQAKITAWELGNHYEGSFHDLEVGDDGLAYVVHIGKQYTATLDPKTGERIFYRLPKGSHGPHSIEPDNDGDMWLTLCVSGEMAKFDLETKEYTILSSAEAPAERGSWPHTLRVDPKDPEGYIWYTDAGRNSVFSLHPKTLVRKEYHLLEAGQVKAGGKGESKGITPYGLDYSPVDGMIWYSKLNGNRIGRIDPKAPDGDITEWNPPFRGPRRLHVAPDGMVWVPGFGSGVFGKFDPETEEWTTYPLPNYINQIPYALNVAPDGMVWICGTGNDTLYRFNPETEYLIEFPLPYRVSYTREIEFDKEGNVWTSTSGPARHMENVCGSLIRLEIPADTKESGGIKLTPIQLSLEEQGILTESQKQNQKQKRNTQLGSLFAKIEARKLPEAYNGKNHQKYVDLVMARLPEAKRNRVGQLFNQRRQSGAKMENAGQTFIRILDYVAEGGKATEIPAEPGPGTDPPHRSMEEKTGIHRLGNTRRSPFDAFIYVNRIPDQSDEGETAVQFAGRILGRLANQEGRVLLKLPNGMDHRAYNGFKTFLGSEPFAEGLQLYFRNGNWSPGELDAILRSKMNEAKKGVTKNAVYKITEADFPDLTAFLATLSDVGDEDFRNLILSARVVDVTKPADTKPKATKISHVSGTIRYDGVPPKRNRIFMDEASRKLHDSPPLDESLLISADGGLANVFVYVKNAPEGEYPMPSEPAIIDQQRSVFEPRIQGFRVGQTVQMKNGDPFIHNVRSLSRANPIFNIVQPAGTPDREKIFEKAEGPITIKCDFHRWMTAHLWVMDHPFFAVTDAHGKFSIPDLPPGEYTLASWHELLGTQEVTIQVEDSTTLVPTLSFRAKEQIQF
jgi:streptogramin lyase/plastocyanin